MIKYLLKKKVKKEATENGKKAMVYAGAVLAGVGMYFSYKAIKKHKGCDYCDDCDYLDEGNYDIYDYDSYDIEKEKNNEIKNDNELEKKVDEFNSRRINCENCPHVSKDEMVSYVEKINDGKKEVKVDDKDYGEGQYEKYEYYEDDLNKKE